MEKRTIEEQITIARSSESTIQELAEMSKSTNEEVRAGVAMNPNTSKDTILSMCDDPSENVRIFLATRSDVKHISDVLTIDKSEAVRDALAKNSSTPSYNLETLAKDRSKMVRTDVRYNPNTPNAVREQLEKKMAREENNIFNSDHIKNVLKEKDGNTHDPQNQDRQINFTER